MPHGETIGAYRRDASIRSAKGILKGVDLLDSRWLAIDTDASIRSAKGILKVS